MTNGIYVPKVTKIISSKLYRAIDTAKGISEEIMVPYDTKKDSHDVLPEEFASIENINECLAFMIYLQDKDK
jgi:hypothetical protein